MTRLPVVRASQIEGVPLERRWLVEGLWGLGDVGILGGEPKCHKSFLALQMAVAVASGKPCLGRFAVPAPGRVLLFAAEDPLHTVRCRLDGLCAQAGVAVDALDLWVITAPVVRLDRPVDCEALAQTVEELRPTLLILDPFVRLHRVDENASAAVAPLLATLRELQRKHGCAILVVHHARKGGAARAGQALRGTSEFHAWGDVTLFLHKVRRGVVLSVEQRAGPGLEGVQLQMGQGPALTIAAAATSDAAPDPQRPEDRVLAALRAAGRPQPSRDIRAACGMQMAKTLKILADLEAVGTIERADGGWRVAVSARPGGLPPEGNGNRKHSAEHQP